MFLVLLLFLFWLRSIRRRLTQRDTSCWKLWQFFGVDWKSFIPCISFCKAYHQIRNWVITLHFSPIWQILYFWTQNLCWKYFYYHSTNIRLLNFYCNVQYIKELWFMSLEIDLEIDKQKWWVEWTLKYPVK